MMKYISIFDCETIPDFEALRAVFGYEGSDEEVANLAYKAQKEKTGSEFLPVNFHKIVNISSVITDHKAQFIRVSSINGEDEKEILEKFTNFINKNIPRLVSFNGRGFDLPLIAIRSMKYNLPFGMYFKVEDKNLNIGKWNNYRDRYSGAFHLDLLDSFQEFGSIRGISLDGLCKTYGLPGKYDTHGDQVLELFLNGEISKISEYCESDALNTYLLYLKYEIIRENLNYDDYFINLNLMKEFINNKKLSYKEPFVECIDKEIEKIYSKITKENLPEVDIDKE